MLDTCINVKIKLKKMEISFFPHYIKAKVAIAGPNTNIFLGKHCKTDFKKSYRINLVLDQVRILQN